MAKSTSIDTKPLPTTLQISYVSFKNRVDEWSQLNSAFGGLILTFDTATRFLTIEGPKTKILVPSENIAFMRI